MLRRVFIILIIATTLSCNTYKKELGKEIEASQFNTFHPENDLLLLHYDCKTDVDDLHSIAAVASSIRIAPFS